MTKRIFASALMLLMAFATVAAPTAFASGPTYKSAVLKNQFGETSINSVIGGSEVDVKFTVAAADAGGKGITGLSAPFGVANVFMHTSQTPATGNPNPAAGYILVELAPNYNGYLASYDSLLSPNSGSSINISSGLTVGGVYIITAVGTSTAANWQAVGLPVGVTPAVGVSFVATSSSAGTGTGTVQVPLATGAGTLVIDGVGSPPVQLSGQAYGSYLIFRALAATSSSVTTLVATAPADGTVISLHLALLPVAAKLH